MRSRSIVLALAPSLAVVLGWVAVVVVPANSEASDLDRRLESIDAEVQSLSSTMSASRELESKISSLQVDLAALESAVPESVDLAGVVRLVDRVADESGLTVALVTPEAPDGADVQAGIPSGDESSSIASTAPIAVAVEVTGAATYTELIAFVDGLVKSERFVLITSLGLEGGQVSDRLNVTLTLEVFSTTPAGSAPASVSADPSASLALDDSGEDPGATLEAVSE